MNGVGYRARRNPWSNLFEAFLTDNLWKPAGLDKPTRVALRVYLQRCIFEFTRANVMPRLTPAQQAEATEAMSEMDKRLKYASAEDPTNTD